MAEADDDTTLAELRDEIVAHLEWEAAWSGFPLADAPNVAAVASPVDPDATVTRAVVTQGASSVELGVPLVVPPAAVSPVEVPAMDRALPRDPHARLAVLAEQAASCSRCRLHEGRTKSVFARGALDAKIVFVGEGPGYHEDQAGEPFVGAAGQLLDKMIDAMGVGRDAVYICNVVKCRPPENRTPLPDEAAACMPFLTAQLDVVAPRVIVALGRCAAENLGCAAPGRGWRGSWGTFRGVPVMPTYHPAYLLRTPEMKRPVWEDLQKVMQRMGPTTG